MMGGSEHTGKEGCSEHCPLDSGLGFECLGGG